MVNVAILIDRDPSTNEMQSLFKIAKSFPKGWNVHIISIYNDDPITDFKHSFKHIYSEQEFSNKPDFSDIENAEKWLGYPFPLLLEGYYFYEQSGWKKSDYPFFLTQLVNFWRRYFLNNNIQVFLSILECDYPQTVAYETAKNLGVETIYVSVSRLGGAMMLLDRDLHPIYRKQVKKFEVENYYNLAVQPIINTGQPVKMEIKKTRGQFRLPDFGAFFKRVNDYYFNFSYFNKLTYPSPLTLAARRFIKDLRRVLVPILYEKADFSKKFFLYSLPHQDEAYNSYYHGIFDNYEIIKIVSRALPSDHLLYVKPHPHYCGSDIPLSKIVEISKLKNVRVVPHDTSSKELLDKCTGVITVGATTGFEAMVYNKSVIVFGKPFYAEPGTVIHVEDLMMLPRILLSVIKTPGYGVNQTKRKKMIANYYKNQIPLESKPYNFARFVITENEAKLLAFAVMASYQLLMKKHKSA